MAVKRYDRGELRRDEGSRLSPEGYLRATAVLTRTGVFGYSQADGSFRRELRLPEEVGKPESIATFRLLPVVDLHPKVPVTSDNARELQRGSVGDTVTFDADSELLSSPICITDRPLIERVLNGSQAEVSCGYECDIEETAGVHPEYGPYDCIQRNIRGNHVALVPRGRAGPDVRVRLDAGDALQIDPTAPAPTPAPASSGVPNMIKVTINGTVIEGSPEDVAKAIQQLMDQAMAAQQTADAKAKAAMVEAENAKAAAAQAQTQAGSQVQAAKMDADKAKADAVAAKAEAEKEKGRADAAEKALKDAEKARVDAEDPKRLSKLVADRVALETRAIKVLGADFKFDALDESAVKLAVLAKLDPEFKAEGKSADYVSAFYDSAIARFEKSNPGLEALRRDAAGMPAPGAKTAEVSAIEAAERRKQRTENAWRGEQPKP